MATNPLLADLPREEWLRPRRNPGEDAFSYAVRLSEANGIRSLRNFFFLQGVGLGDTALMSTVRVIAAVGRCDADDLKRDSFIRRNRSYALNGETISSQRYSPYSPRLVCPSCLRQDRTLGDPGLKLPRSWLRSWWRIDGVTACHVHCERLLDRCACGRKLDGWLRDVAACSCGLDLALLPSEPVATANAATYVVGRLGHSSRRRVPFLDALNLEAALKAMEVFGREHLGPDADIHDVMEKGLEIIEDPDRIIRETADRIVARSPQRYGTVGGYGRAWLFARGMRPGKVRDRLMTIIKDHARQTRGWKKVFFVRDGVSHRRSGRR